MSELSERTEADEMALVATPYLLGGVAFSLGAYCGVLTVINVPNKDTDKVDWFIYSSKHWAELRRYLGWEALVGYLSYVLGVSSSTSTLPWGIALGSLTCKRSSLFGSLQFW